MFVDNESVLTDVEILDRIFTMLDKTGDDLINFKEFAVGVAPLVNGDATDKLNCKSMRLIGKTTQNSVCRGVHYLIIACNT